MKPLSFTTTIGILKHLKGMHYLEISKQVVTKIGGIGSKHRFDLLQPSIKRYVLNYVATVKSQQLHIERAFLLISNLKQIPLGKENFRKILGKN